MNKKYLSIVALLVAFFITGCSVYVNKITYKGNLDKSFDVSSLEQYMGQSAKDVKIKYGKPDYEDGKTIVYHISKYIEVNAVSGIGQGSKTTDGTVTFTLKNGKVINIENTLDKPKTAENKS